MAIFSCSLCEEKNNRLSDKDKEIARLVDQLEMFKSLVFPKANQVVDQSYIELGGVVNLDNTVVEQSAGDYEQY